MTCRVSSIGPDGSRPRRRSACGDVIADSCARRDNHDARVSIQNPLKVTNDFECVPACAPPTTRARSRRAQCACAGASGIGTIPLGVRSDGNVRACRRCGVDVTDRTAAAPWFRRVPRVHAPPRAPVERPKSAGRPRAPRRAYPVPRDAGGSSTLAARHPFSHPLPAPSRF
jgi:hypothetical protein